MCLLTFQYFNYDVIHTTNLIEANYSSSGVDLVEVETNYC